MATQRAQQDAAVAARARFMNVETARSSAKLGVTLSLVGVPICCAPLSIVGAVLGVRAIRLAKAEGIAAPTQAYIAIAGAILSTAILSYGIVVSQLDARTKEQHLGAVHARLAPRREAAVLDAKLACDLVEERILEDGLAGNTAEPEVHCDGAVEPRGARASMSRVHVKQGSNQTTLTACFLRGPAWFVLATSEKSDCNAAPAPSMPAILPANDAEKRALEKRLREDYAKALNPEAPASSAQ